MGVGSGRVAVFSMCVRDDAEASAAAAAADAAAGDEAAAAAPYILKCSELHVRVPALCLQLIAAASLCSHCSLCAVLDRPP